MAGDVDATLLALLAVRNDAGFAPSLGDDDWQTLVRESVRHGVAPMVLARLQRDGASWDVPASVRLTLKACHLRTGLENLRLLTQLGRLLREWRAQGIDAIVLKGAYLAQAVYGEPALRSMGDADILVRRADLARAAALLRDGGWQSTAAAPAEGDRGHQLPVFVRGGAQLELHWAIEDDDSPFAVDADGLWQRAIACDVGGAPALALSPEDLLLHLSLHAAYGHGWLQFEGGLRPLADIAACLRHFEGRLDWDALAARARAWGTHPSLWLTLRLARDLLGAAVPQAALDRLAPPRAGARHVAAATALVLGHHYRDLVDCLPVLGRAWLTKRWHRLPRAVHWRTHALPRTQSLAHAYPRLSATWAPLRYAAHWSDLLRDVARACCGTRARRLVAQERDRLRLLRWLEAPGALPR